MNIRHVLLGSAAGLLAVTGANAADLPGEVPAAVDYVKICDTYGTGFFYIPGTETCLDISGRARFRVQYNTWSTPGLLITPDEPEGVPFTLEEDEVRFRADARLQFDARNSTEWGQLRTFIEISDGFGGGDGADDNGIELDQAFIQLGYLTVGLHDDVANGDVLYGDNSFGWFTGDNTLVGATVRADDLGGGFYIGAGIYSGSGGRDNWVYYDSNLTKQEADVDFNLAVGVADQSWGSLDVSAVYGINPYESVLVTGINRDAQSGGPDFWSIKGTADLILSEGFNARLVAGYYDTDAANTDVITLAGALSYAFTDAATVYTGIRYDLKDGDDMIGANLGVDYTITSGLVLTGEVSYMDEGDADAFTGMLQLARSW